MANENTVTAIRRRLEQRRAPMMATCQSCGQQQEQHPAWQPMAGLAARDEWRCQRCGGQMFVTFTTSTGPSPDDDIAWLLAALADAQSRSAVTAADEQTNYRRGDRVRQNALCPRTKRCIERGIYREGVVVGPGQRGLIRVHLDGDAPSTITNYHKSFIEPVNPPQPAPVPTQET